MSMKYGPEAAAMGLRSQGRKMVENGPGGMVPKPADKLRDGKGMGYRLAQAAKCLNEWGEADDAPHQPKTGYNADKC